VLKAGKPTIAILMAGRPLTFHSTAEHMDAVLYAWHPGTMGGPAICGALFGDIVPSGRLTTTFPRSVGQVPLYYDHLNTGRPAEETGPEASNKFTSKYLDVPFTPEYPFGFGLSYTTFAYTNIGLSTTNLHPGERMTIQAEIANTGTRDADEVVQLYTRQLAGSLTRPVRELRAFRRVHLKAGEKQKVEFTLTTSDLAYYLPGGTLTTEPGRFQVWVAPDSASGEMAEFQVVQ
jgi:beta-glucosidase